MLIILLLLWFLVLGLIIIVDMRNWATAWGVAFLWATIALIIGGVAYECFLLYLLIVTLPATVYFFIESFRWAHWREFHANDGAGWPSTKQRPEVLIKWLPRRVTRKH